MNLPGELLILRPGISPGTRCAHFIADAASHGLSFGTSFGLVLGGCEAGGRTDGHVFPNVGTLI